MLQMADASLGQTTDRPTDPLAAVINTLSKQLATRFCSLGEALNAT